MLVEPLIRPLSHSSILERFCTALMYLQSIELISCISDSCHA